MEKSENKNVVELCGHRLTICKSGLNEKEVASLVQELTNQRDTLLQRQEHISSLTKLAEKTIIEADALAQQLKEEAKRQAENEGKSITARAEEQTRQMVKEKLAVAEKEAEAIKNGAKRQADLLFEENKKRLQSDLADTLKSTCSELASQIESLKQKITAFGANTERILSESVEQGNSLITGQERNSILPEATLEASPPVASTTNAEVSRKSETREPPESEEQKTEVLVPGTKAGDTDYQGQVALEFKSPVNVSKVLGIIMHLNGLSELSVGEYLPLVDKPLLMVFLRQPKNLLQILRALPEVALAEEVISKDEVALTGYPYTVRGERRVQIKLSEDPVPGQTKEASIQLSGISG